jgi:hypothetical protein
VEGGGSASGTLIGVGDHDGGAGRLGGKLIGQTDGLSPFTLNELGMKLRIEGGDSGLGN